jgi:hypothetical protein
MIIDVDFMWGVDKAIKKLRPDAKFELVNTEFTKWEDVNSKEPPSWDDILKEIEKDKEEYERQKYARDRASKYPNAAEQLDDLWHIINSGKVIDHNSNWFKHIKSIKEQYPKP